MKKRKEFTLKRDNFGHSESGLTLFGRQASEIKTVESIFVCQSDNKLRKFNKDLDFCDEKKGFG